MSKLLYVDVPQDLADILFEDGFDEPYVSRSGDPITDSISAAVVLANSVASVGANAVTILVGAGQLRLLGHNIIAWLRQRGGDSAELKATVRVNGRQLDVSIKVSGDPGESDTRALKDFSDALSSWIDS